LIPKKRGFDIANPDLTNLKKKQNKLENICKNSTGTHISSFTTARSSKVFTKISKKFLNYCWIRKEYLTGSGSEKDPDPKKIRIKVQNGMKSHPDPS